jgi:hypothetical protein
MTEQGNARAGQQGPNETLEPPRQEGQRVKEPDQQCPEHGSYEKACQEIVLGAKQRPGEIDVASISAPPVSQRSHRIVQATQRAEPAAEDATHEECRQHYHKGERQPTVQRTAGQHGADCEERIKMEEKVYGPTTNPASAACREQEEEEQEEESLVGAANGSVSHGVTSVGSRQSAVGSSSGAEVGARNAELRNRG